MTMGTNRAHRAAATALAAAMLMIGIAGYGALTGTSGPAGAAVPDDPATVRDTGRRIVDADAHPGDWLSTGRNYQETHYSPLRQIDTANVARLGLAWSYDLDTNRGQESTALAVDGVIYTTSAWSKVQAFDGVSGRLLWQYDPKVPGETAIKACCDVVNRGAAYWNGKVYVGTLDGRVIAIDARTGRMVWSVVTVDQSRNYTITGAPRVVKGRVLIGNGGAEYGVRGYISAYDAETGRMDWRFYTVPGEPGHPDHAASDAILAKLAEKTWSPESWRLTGGGGGGTVWDSMSYDPELDLLYVGVGNGGFWAQKFRSPSGPPGGDNDNLFLASIVALRPETGDYVWHLQQTPGDQWDYTSTQNMILTDLDIDGRTRKVLLQAPKNGLFYVVDRTDGRLLSAKPFSEQNWSSGVDPVTGRPKMDPAMDYSRTGKPWLGKPGPLGAHSWPPMSYSARTRLAYIPTQETTFRYMVEPGFKPLPRGYNMGVDTSADPLPVDPRQLATIRSTIKGYLVAWDPVRQQAAWRIPHDNGANGGVLSTAGGLVFEGGESGIFRAYRDVDGKPLWSFDAQSGVIAAPITWQKDGVQYVTVVVGWGGAQGLTVGPIGWSDKGPRRNISRVLTFRIGATAKLPPVPVRPKPQLQLVPQFADAATVEKGRHYYQRSCYACHGPSAVSGGLVPDLRYSPAITDRDAWNSVVLDGALQDNGMVSFKGTYTADQLDAIRAYIIGQAHLTNAATTAAR